MPLTIVQGNIAQMRTDAVVNAANEELLAGGGVCGALFAGAGYADMQRACAAIGHCATGGAVVTPGFALPARFVIHAVGPVWRGGAYGEETLLRSAYRRALEAAVSVGARSVAFPLISAGIYGYPQREALRVASEEIRTYLASDATDAGASADACVGTAPAGAGAAPADELDVYLVIYNRATFAQALDGYGDVAAFVRSALEAPEGAVASAGAAEPAAAPVPKQAPPLAPEPTHPLYQPTRKGPVKPEHAPFKPGRAKPRPARPAEPEDLADEAFTCDYAAMPSVGATPAEASALEASAFTGRASGAAAMEAVAAASATPTARAVRDASPEADEIAELLESLDASFASTVLALIDERGLTDVEVYKRANLSRQVFSKLRRDDGYRPTKQTAVALACALDLDLDQTRALLARAGYALSRANKFDVIVEYFISRGRHDVFELNEMLFAFDQPLLGSL